MKLLLTIALIIFCATMSFWATKHRAPWSLNDAVHGIPRLAWIGGGAFLALISIWS